MAAAAKPSAPRRIGRPPARSSTPRKPSDNKEGQVVIWRGAQLSLSDATVQTAHDMLMNNAVVKTSESKLHGTTHVQSVVDFPKEVLAAARGLFSATKTYDFVLHASMTSQATVGGVIQGTFAWSPSSTSYSEWTALAALFDEVKLLGSHLTWSAAFTPPIVGATYIQTQVSLGADHINTSVPLSFTAVTRLPGAEEFSVGSNMGHGGSNTLVKRVRSNPGRNYAPTATPSSTTTPVIGCAGQWAWASNIVTTPSLNYAYLSLRTMIRLRSRA